MKSSALVQELGSVQMQVAERWQDEAAVGDLYGIREVLTIIRTEADDESVAVDLYQQRVSVRT